METVRFVFRCEEIFDSGEQKENVLQSAVSFRPLKEELLGALIGLSKVCGGAGSAQTTDLIIEGLNTAALNIESDEDQIRSLTKQVREEPKRLAGSESESGNWNEYDLGKLWEGEKDIASVKCMILLGICGMAVDACLAKESGHRDEKLNGFFIRALSVISDELSLEELLPVMIEAGEMNFKCIELLDNAIQEKSTTSILLEESHPAENGNSRGLPFSIGFSWHETKTVCFFLTLLYLGNRPVYVGRRLPSFLTEPVFSFLTEHYNVTVLDSDED